MALSLEEKLSVLADRETVYESGSTPLESAGGNFDDAHDDGMKDGATLLARELINEFFPNRRTWK